MDINTFQNSLDKMFEENRISEVSPFLMDSLSQALGEQDTSAIIFILNEMIGFYRQVSEYELAKTFGQKALAILEGAGEEKSIHYATTLINLATALRTSGELDKAGDYFKQAEELYVSHFGEDAFELANLYNNEALLYQEKGEYDKAIDFLRKALVLAENFPEKKYEQAVSNTNLGCSIRERALLNIKSNQDSAEEFNLARKYAEELNIARNYLEKAVSLFGEIGEHGPHMAGAYAGLGDVYFSLGELEKSDDYYEKALYGLVSTVGHNDAYFRVYHKREDVIAKINENGKHIESRGMDICRRYFDEKIFPMLKADFNRILSHMCIGLFGEGSDAYGYDDLASRDHDFGPGVVILIDDKKIFDRYGQQIQDKLLEIAKKTPDFYGIKPDISSIEMGRRGVFWIDDYYQKFTGVRLLNYIYECIKNGFERDKISASKAAVASEKDISIFYLMTNEYSLSAAVNGEIFYDGNGKATAIRSFLKGYYPQSIYKKVLMQEITYYSQYGQYNYRRMRQRGDILTARLMLMSALKSAAHIEYICRGIYMPHDKWIFGGLKKLNPSEGLYNKSIPSRFSSFADKIIEADAKIGERDVTDSLIRPVMEVFDELAFYLEDMLYGAQMITDKRIRRTYMEDMIPEIEKKELVERVVLDEWKAFDKVINEGGRADCQDNWNTFHLMRASQYNIWTIPMLRQYVEDFEALINRGWNPIMEKYGRMEASTAPEEYAKIEKDLPAVSEEKIAIIEEIVKVQVSWMEEFAKEYPCMAGNARSIHTYEDNPYNTSYETYLRGELMTYSDEMLAMYGAFIVDIAGRGENLAYLTMEQTAFLYGYDSLEAAEAALE